MKFIVLLITWYGCVLVRDAFAVMEGQSTGTAAAQLPQWLLAADAVAR